MSLALVPHPMAGSIGRTTSRRDTDPEIPPGQPVITRLGSYTHRAPGDELALACRTCGTRFGGTSHTVHAELRTHWAEQHKPPITVNLIKAKRPKPTKAKKRGVPAGPPCDTTLRLGPRAGKTCGKKSSDGTCWEHKHPGSSTIRNKRRDDPRHNTAAWPKDRACAHCGAIFVVPTPRHERAQYCGDSCMHRASHLRRKARRSGAA